MQMRVAHYQLLLPLPSNAVDAAGMCKDARLRTSRMQLLIPQNWNRTTKAIKTCCRCVLKKIVALRKQVINLVCHHPACAAFSPASIPVFIAVWLPCKWRFSAGYLAVVAGCGNGGDGGDGGAGGNSGVAGLVGAIVVVGAIAVVAVAAAVAAVVLLDVVAIVVVAVAVVGAVVIDGVVTSNSNNDSQKQQQQENLLINSRWGIG